MQHKSIDELRRVADVTLAPPAAMSRRERLAAWAAALEREGDRPLRLFYELEFTPRRDWGRLRVEDSPLTVALRDPVLRAQGLESDGLTDAIAFFGLSRRQTHRLLCSCMHGSTLSSRKASRIVRGFAQPVRRAAFATATVAACALAPAALFWFA